jgi:hypothetical protein
MGLIGCGYDGSVPPLQGGGCLWRDVYPGLRAARFTPGYHIAGLRPCVSERKDAFPVINRE